MRTILQSALVLIALLTVPAPAGIEAATIIFNDGGVHTISGPSDPVAVSNGTTLIIQDGAVISGGTPPISIDPTSIFTATGGSITGDPMSLALSAAGSTTISGGTFQGGDGGSVASGGSGAAISGPATISGGTFQGGVGNGFHLFGGDGAHLSGPATISGGTFHGGDGFLFGGDGAHLSGPATISGGTFQGGFGFFGGSLGTSLSIQGAPTSFQVQGGHFASPISLVLSGGEVDFFGNLTFTGTFTGGQLTGVLADGTSLDQPVFLSANITVLSSPGEVRFLGPGAVVPEPASLVLMGLGLMGVAGLARWTRSRRNGDRCA